MKLVETEWSDEDCRSFRWMRGKEEIANITIYKDGLVEFSSIRSGDIGIECIGQKDETISIDQMVIQVGTVRPGGVRAKLAKRDAS